MSKNIELDKFYTPKETAKKCIDLFWNTFFGVTEIIEPSAGNGNFSLQIPNCIAYDLEPEHESITKQDFLQLDLPYKQGRAFIGNPPFGDRNNLSRSFYKHACKMGDMIAFILPISQLDNTDSLYLFDLVKSVDLGVLEYSGMKVHCCFNLYHRPKNGKLNSKPKLNSDLFKLLRTGDLEFEQTKADFMFCKRGSVGKEILEEGKRYGDEYKVVVFNKSNLHYIKNTILGFDWQNYKKHQSSPNISKNDIYRLFKSEGKKEKINVLSLFDGMSCGQIALNKVGIEYENYFASEIDKYAIQVTQKNYPNTKQLGSVTELDGTKLPKIDLMFGGSPCQDLSSSNVWTEQKGLEGKKSSLFWEFVRLLKEVKPKYFLLENVGSAKNSDIEIIDRELGVKGIKFNSKLVLPQNRNRVYWTNIPFELPKKEMTLTMQDLLENSVDDKYYITQKMYDCIISPATKGWQSGKMDIDLKIARPLTATMHKMHRADTDNYVTGIAPQGKTNVRRLTPIECERLQGVKDNYTDCVSDTQRYRMLGNGWTVDVIAHIFSFLKGGEIFNNFSNENV